VLLHYLQRRGTFAHADPLCTVNIGQYVRRNVTGAALRAHSLQGRQGNAVRVFQEWTGLSHCQVRTLDPGWLATPDAASMIAEYLVTNGPALVSGLAMHAAGLDNCSILHSGPSTERSVGATTAVLLAWSRVGKQEIYFLVQTWWRHKPFLEVDAAYLASRDAHLTWALAPVALPRASLVCGRAVECHACGFDSNWP
jgi:hypothetical protein